MSQEQTIAPWRLLAATIAHLNSYWTPGLQLQAADKEQLEYCWYLFDQLDASPDAIWLTERIGKMVSGLLKFPPTDGERDTAQRQPFSLIVGNQEIQLADSYRKALSLASPFFNKLFNEKNLKGNQPKIVLLSHDGAVFRRLLKIWTTDKEVTYEDAYNLIGWASYYGLNAVTARCMTALHKRLNFLAERGSDTTALTSEERVRIFLCALQLAYQVDHPMWESCRKPLVYRLKEFFKQFGLHEESLQIVEGTAEHIKGHLFIYPELQQILLHYAAKFLYLKGGADFPRQKIWHILKLLQPKRLFIARASFFDLLWAANIPSLRSLSIYQWEKGIPTVLEEQQIALRIPHLRRLTIGIVTTEFMEQVFPYLATVLCRLKSLQLFSYVGRLGFSAENFQMLAENLPELRSFTLGGRMSHLCSYRRKYLDISYKLKTTELMGLATLSRFAHLETLALIDKLIIPLMEFSALSKLSTLKLLKIGNCSIKTSSGHSKSELKIKLPNSLHDFQLRNRFVYHKKRHSVEVQASESSTDGSYLVLGLHPSAAASADNTATTES